MSIKAEKRELLMRAHHNSMIWTRFGLLFLGFWLLMSPPTFGYLNKNLIQSDLISGILLVLFGLISMSYRLRGWIYGACIVGIWLQFAPLAFWSQESVIYVNDTLIGIIVIALCVFVPLRPKELEKGPKIPPGWSYNPSSSQQRISIVFLAMIGWFLARYMASFQLHYIHHVWDPFFGMGTEKVITSIISQDFPVADAGLGAMAYSLEAIMAVKGGSRRWHTMPWIVLSFGILAIPVGLVSIILIMLQPLVVGAWCGLCLLIAACMLLILVLTVDEVVAVCQYMAQVKREKKPFWRIFFHGSEYEEDGEDLRTPSFNAPAKVFKSMFWGMTLPIHLVITALLGCILLFSNFFIALPPFIDKSIDVLAALIIVFSIISWAEVIRAARFINIGFALLLAILPFLSSASRNLKTIVPLVVIALVIMVLSLFRGKIKERYGSWDCCIF